MKPIRTGTVYPHLRSSRLTIAILVLLLWAVPAGALSPEEVFEKVAPSIVVVHVHTGDEKPSALGSGLIVEPDQVVTNCHVLTAGLKTYVSKQDRRFSAELRFADVDRDLCLLAVRGLNGRPVELAPMQGVKPGARVFAIGSPRGLELTISDGLVSGLRRIEGSQLIQTSAPISRGSSGGGLFDTSGRLLGVTTFTLAEGQNLNFALPADWISQLRVRSNTEARRFATERKVPVADRPPSSEYADSPSVKLWLPEMSRRTEAQFPNAEERKHFLLAAHYESVRSGLDPQVVLSLVEELSQFQKFRVSETGALGFMQVMPAWVSRIGTPDHNLFNLRTNLRYGCVILRHYIDKYDGNMFRALNAYRNQSLGKPDGFAIDTQAFASFVLARWRNKWQFASTR